MYEAYEEIKKTYEQLEKLKKENPSAWDLFEAKQNSMHEEANMISSAMAEGRAEVKKEAAISAIKNGLSIESTSDITGLTIEEVKLIKSQI